MLDFNEFAVNEAVKFLKPSKYRTKFYLETYYKTTTRFVTLTFDAQRETPLKITELSGGDTSFLMSKKQQRQILSSTFRRPRWCSVVSM